MTGLQYNDDVDDDDAAGDGGGGGNGISMWPPHCSKPKEIARRQHNTCKVKCFGACIYSKVALLYAPQPTKLIVALITAFMGRGGGGGAGARWKRAREAQRQRHRPTIIIFSNTWHIVILRTS